MFPVAYGPLGVLVAKGVEKAMESFTEKTRNSNLEILKEEAFRADITSKVMQEQAKVEQELAIARRIDSAEEVEIEEYYDTSGKGNLGFKTDGEDLSFGASGEGRKITKRIIKFKGCRPKAIESI